MLKGSWYRVRWLSAWFSVGADRNKLLAEMIEESCLLIDDLKRDEDTPRSSDPEVTCGGTDQTESERRSSDPVEEKPASHLERLGPKRTHDERRPEGTAVGMEVGAHRPSPCLPAAASESFCGALGVITGRLQNVGKRYFDANWVLDWKSTYKELKNCCVNKNLNIEVHVSKLLR